MCSDLQLETERTCLPSCNLLVWAIPTLILREDEAATELHKQHHSRDSNGMDGLIESAQQQEEVEKRNANSTQLEDREQAYLKRVNRAIFKANNGSLRAAKQAMTGSKQATPAEE